MGLCLLAAVVAGYPLVLILALALLTLLWVSNALQATGHGNLFVVGRERRAAVAQARRRLLAGRLRPGETPRAGDPGDLAAGRAQPPGANPGGGAMPGPSGPPGPGPWNSGPPGPRGPIRKVGRGMSASALLHVAGIEAEAVGEVSRQLLLMLLPAGLRPGSHFAQRRAKLGARHVKGRRQLAQRRAAVVGGRPRRPRCLERFLDLGRVHAQLVRQRLGELAPDCGAARP